MRGVNYLASSYLSALRHITVDMFADNEIGRSFTMLKLKMWCAALLLL